MCSKAVILVVLCVVVDLTAGFTIREKHSKKEDVSASLRTLAGYRKRLQAQGLIPNVEQHDSQDVRNFDELELLQLIPATIKQLRHDLLSAEERRSEPRDAVLSVLLNSREVRLGKKDINQKFQNDIEGNSVQKVYKPADAKTVQLSDDLTVEPSQRILRMVAAIVQKAYKDLAARRPAPTPTPKKIRSKRSNSINLENVKVTIHMPRVKRSPSIPLKSTIGLSAEEKRRVEEANEAAIMEAVLAQIGGNSLDEDEDYEEEDYEEEEEPELKKSSSDKVVLPKLGEIEEDEDDDEEDAGDDLHGAMPDYAYDDIAGSDDYFMEEYKPARFSGGDFENPSVNELIMLAAKHRTHRRSDSGIRASSYRTESEEYEY
ncbi:hypothetical protein pipiens_006788 [Culex pipiens pipiens]|uniref:Uncharacterized protein n=1 Tax=Culex pipiens pipiens TaxID=38569 RepID=A0ABD1DN74_CULPP